MSRGCQFDCSDSLKPYTRKPIILYKRPPPEPCAAPPRPFEPATITENILEVIILLCRSRGNTLAEIVQELPEFSEQAIRMALQAGLNSGLWLHSVNLQTPCLIDTWRYVLNPEMDANAMNREEVLFILSLLGCPGTRLYVKWIKHECGAVGIYKTPNCSTFCCDTGKYCDF